VTGLPWDLISVDLETAGDPGHRIVEIGAVRIDRDYRITDRWSSLVDGRPLDDKVVKIHGITADMLAGKPTFAEVHSAFDEWCQKSDYYVLAPWGAYFDIPVLRAEYRRCGVKYPHRGEAFDLKTIVWQDLIKRGFPAKSCKVERALQLMGLQFEGTPHRAPDDAYNEARAYLAALRILPTSAPKET
jgi:DNA polymerase III epsilon subunit-like protein